MDGTAKRAETYANALELGLADYAWQDVPIGTWRARLDFKAWGKGSGLSLICCFTALDSGAKYRLTAYDNHDTGTALSRPTCDRTPNSDRDAARHYDPDSRTLRCHRDHRSAPPSTPAVGHAPQPRPDCWPEKSAPCMCSYATRNFPQPLPRSDQPRHSCTTSLHRAAARNDRIACSCNSCAANCRRWAALSAGFVVRPLWTRKNP